MLKGVSSETEHFIDALPYIDTITSDETKIVEKLITEEMTRSEKQPADYLKEMQNEGLPSFGGSELLQQEYQRVKSKQSMPPIDSQRYELSAPPLEQQNDLGAWNATLNNAYAQLEHQHLRNVNLELALKYSPELWKMSNEQTNKLTEEYSKSLEDVKEEILNTNKRRKLFQTETGIKLRKLETEWMELVIKNFNIAQACAKKRRNSS